MWLLAVVGPMALVCASPASADRVPYRLSVAVPARVSSPPVDPAAPFTPLVRSLIAQLEPSNPPTPFALENAAKLLHGVGTAVAGLGVGGISNCTTIGSNDAPTGTDPAIAPLCWADALGINVEAGRQVRQTTAPPLRVGMSSSWDPDLLNAWGQVEGREGRWLGVTGIYAPQADLVRIPNWGRNLTVFGEDPFEDGTLAAAEINGVQGKGLMAQIKHFAMYNGQFMEYDTKVQDQAAHELYLTPYEYGTSGSGILPRPGSASSMMCSYARYEIVAAPGITSGPPSELAPTGGALSCDNELKNYVAHKEWGWPGFFASDYYIAMDSTVQAIESGTDQELPTSIFFGDPLVAAVEAGVVPLSTFNGAVARILYQEQRFHLLGHADANSNYLSPSHPTDHTGAFGLTAAQKHADAAVAEKASEEGAVLLKNSARTLPLTKRDLHRGVLVVGESAEYMPADPGTEQANGYVDRDAISPLEQLKTFAPRGSKVTYLPYLPGTAPVAGDGVPVPHSALSTNGTTVGNGITRTAGPSAPRTDSKIDFTKLSSRGQLAFGRSYTWSGYIDVPTSDDYTFRFQFSVPSFSITQPTGNNPGNVTPPSCTGAGAPTFSLATNAGTGQKLTAVTLSQSPSTLGTIQTDPTMSGYTERGLANCLFQAGQLSPGMHQIQISWMTPRSFAPDSYHLREPRSKLPSLRFAYSRARGDENDALAAARSASKVIVFADCTCVSEGQFFTPDVNSLDGSPTKLIEDMAHTNHNTAVVTNFDVGTLMPWLSKVKSVLQMWYPGSEGGTATARLLLGLADPSGHLTTTWPGSTAYTLWNYPEATPLYVGDTTGTHPERLSQTNPIQSWDEGIFVGYRFFDKEGITPLFPFGWALSYTSFRFSQLTVRRNGGGLNVGFDVTNTGNRTGAEVPQVYVGPAPRVPPGVQQAVRSLVGFDRIVLRPHQTRRETIRIGPGSDDNGYGDRRAFQYWSTPQQAWVTAPGARTIWVGDADTPSRLMLTGTWSATRPPVKRHRMQHRHKHVRGRP
jgi:beta-glucosidase